MKRQRVMVAVWKEKLTYSQSVSASEKIVQLTERDEWPFATALAPNPFSYVGVNKVIAGTPIRLCSQNVLWNSNSGSYIGETTIEMLLEFKCDYVIVGHSERRIHFKESNEMIVNRALAAISAGIRPILCIGDTAEDRELRRERDVITAQLSSFLKRIPDSVREQDFMIAYEPVWAISTWRNSAPLPSGEEVQELHAHLRDLIAEIKNSDFASRISLLYGGSVAPDNAEGYMSQEDVDGALVGGASKTPESFVETLKAARLGFQKKDMNL
jgi:triosephosphate isomerase